MAEVNFVVGTQSMYNGLGFYSRDTFYKTDKNLYLGDKKLTRQYDLKINPDGSVTLIYEEGNEGGSSQ